MYKLKRLEWEKSESRITTSTVFGKYDICSQHTSPDRIVWVFTPKSSSSLSLTDSFCAPSVESAKRAIWEHYRNLIDPALEIDSLLMCP